MTIIKKKPAEKLFQPVMPGTTALAASIPSKQDVPTTDVKPKITFTNKGVTADIGEKSYNFTKEQWGTMQGKGGAMTPEMEAYQEEAAKNIRLQRGEFGKLKEFAQAANKRNYIYKALAAGKSYSQLMEELSKGQIGEQPEEFTKEQLEAELTPIPEKGLKPTIRETIEKAEASPFVSKQEAKKGLATTLQLLEISKQWVKMAPGVGGIFGKGATNTVSSITETWDQSSKILNENIGKIKTGDINYRDVLDDIEGAQSAMIQYEGYIHGLGQVDPDYLINEGLNMEMKLSQYQNSLEAYKLEIVSAENVRRVNTAQLENQELYGMGGVTGQ